VEKYRRLLETNCLFDLTLKLRCLRAALDPGLALPLRIELLRAGLVRSALLATDGTSFARELVQHKPAYADGLNSYLHTTNDAQEFEAVFWMLHHPELQPWVRAGAQRQTRGANR
jgi:hypothetical protein